ncbi:MAG: HslU--HslV peptidase proteolytic subunit [Candidatus Goldiibacteriota bacterium HGW-Goldbacteria-1]|jgi:ATP-dependent HslUV protease subunit HslV|nr:MAG: HslU--HslV peptidase proteolytic subunit [Candidatus Goldiibacteriota bacterium HGW-Goldbacteria-1]
MFHATTILCVRKNGKTVIGGDGQVTMGNTIMKQSAKKVRTIEGKNKIIAGFAGSVADAFTLFDRFEAKLKEHNWLLQRAAVELAKDWRTDKMLKQLDALLIVADSEKTYVVSGNGEVIEPEDGITAIGSGGTYALAAARAMSRFTDKSAREIVAESMKIASEICIYTNDNITIEEL